MSSATLEPLPTPSTGAAQTALPLTLSTGAARPRFAPKVVP